ncbi:beta-glucuronidase LacZ4 [Draconibacterium mangrovi]|uniref:beta-glucuronidase LacZ4 n=1 Tax=Draconibacterium mangrovi TaxID=2697469 RepID=UPI0013D2468A|nr:glycoside hydrolase family 2 TIM barrel-domain containing protein [Draconibacterium mangrovi]
MKRTIVFLTIFFVGIISIYSREVVSLNQNWDFAFGYEVKKEVWESVNVPHTWNDKDALNGNPDYFRGEGIYRKIIDIPKDWEAERLFLQFEGVNTVANVFINGKHVGEHRGGYTAFNFEITDVVKYGQENEIRVRVSNALFLDVMPLLGDFNFYGGIYRNVSILRTSRTCVSPLDYASSGVYLTPLQVTEDSAEFESEIRINSASGGEFDLEMRILDNNRLVVSKTKNVSLNHSGQAVVKLPFQIKNPHLWDGVNDPFMYTAVVLLKENNQLIDSVKQSLGIRYFSVDPEQGVFLNGKHIQLRGVCRHQDRSEIGNALLPQHHNEDLALILEMGANAIRLAHYPNDQYFYNLLDEAGLVTWSEIPFVGPGGYRNKGFVDQTSFRENGKLQLTEMIKQNYNHPGILFWGLFNELKEDGDNPASYLAELQALAHQLDPSRITSAASNINGEINHITDLIAWNRYYGWYGGKPEEIGNWADRVHKNFPGRCIGISEYGAGASISQHENELKKPVATSKWHPEAWQAYYHEENWKAIDSRPYLWGTYIWNMFDFGAAHRTEGDSDGRNDKGLISFDRKVKKDAFWFYKANWNTKEPTLYITNRRFTERETNVTDIKVYSSFNEVELFINGKSQGVQQGNYATFIWEKRQLQNGENKIEVKAGKGKKRKTDVCIWKVINE